MAFQLFVLGMLDSVWCMGSLEPQPKAFPQFEAFLHGVSQFQLELGLLRGRRVARPVRAAAGFRLHARFRLFPQRQLRITHCKICWTAVRRRELPFSANVILEERPEMLRRLDKFDLVTHSKEHIEECACHLSGKQFQSWPVMDRSPCSATSETPAMANGTNVSSAFLNLR